MAIMKLKMGVDSNNPSENELRRRERVLAETVEYYLPNFAKGMKELKAKEEQEGEGNVMILHQDAFASGLHTDEYTILGMAVKYAGLHGVELRIIGRNHETF